eukprot:1138567-Rhodomonas_salina.1
MPTPAGSTGASRGLLTVSDVSDCCVFRLLASVSSAVSRIDCFNCIHVNASLFAFHSFFHSLASISHSMAPGVS